MAGRSFTENTVNPAILSDGPSPSAGVSNDPTTQLYRVVLAWTVAIVLLMLFARTRIGYVLIYYALALALVYMALTNYQFFQFALQPITSGTAFQDNGGQTSGGQSEPHNPPHE